MVVINADKMVLGRMASVAAKQALLGEDVRIVNCERAVIKGNKRQVIADYSARLELGQPQQGPFVQRRPDLFVRKTVRGMLPRKMARGRDAFSRVKCYIGVPKEFEGKAFSSEKLTTAKSSRDYITVAELCMHLGDKRR